MRISGTLFGALALLLAGCQVTVNPPPPVGGFPPGGFPPGGGNIVQARQACTGQARAQGLNVQTILSERQIAGGGGQIVAAEILMRVRRGGQSFQAICTYSYRNGIAQVNAGGGGFPPPPPPPQPQDPGFGPAVAACRAEASRFGWQTVDIVSRSYVRRGRVVVAADIGMSLRRGGSRVNRSCRYTYATGTASIPNLGGFPPPQPPRPQPPFPQPQPPIGQNPALLNRAEQLCRAEAARQGVIIQQVLSRQFVPGGATLQMQTGRGDNTRYSRCDVIFATNHVFVGPS